MVAVTISAILGAIFSAATIAFNSLLDLLNRFGFPAYWLVLVGILYADMGGLIPFATYFDASGTGAGNFFGALFSVFTKFFFNIELSTTVLFVGVLCGGCIWFLWKSKEGLGSP